MTVNEAVAELAFLNGERIAAEREQTRLERRLSGVESKDLSHIWRGIFEQADIIADLDAAIRRLIDGITAHQLSWCHLAEDCALCVSVNKDAAAS